MKKLSAVLLSILMVLTCLVPMASAYDKAAVVGGDYSALTDDDVLGVVLDWLDAKIAAVAPDFDEFEQYAGLIEAAGITIPEITGLDSLVEYKDHLADLEGDFANLTNTKLIVKRADAGNTGFVNGMIAFMAANADTFGKVFRWDDQVFDYGKVGEYIETLEETDPIRVFYNDYLVGGNIQDKFIREIAREMNYDVPETRTETFDEILDNGIKEALAPVLKEILTSQASKDAYDAFDLKTTDVYALVKAYVGLLQNDYKGDFDNLLSGFLTALQGMVQVVKEAINIEPPTVTVGDANGVIGTYQPTNTDVEIYMPKIYSPYKDQLQGTDYYDMIEGTTVPEEYAAITAGEGTDMAQKFVMNVAPVPAELTEAGYTFPIEIEFSAIEQYANQAIADMLPTIQASVDGIVSAIPIGTNSVVINSITVSLSYKGYATDDEFVVEVTATPNIDYTATGMVSMFQSAVDSAIENAIASYVQNPAATIVVDNLSSIGDLDLADIQKLVDYIDTDADYDNSLLDVSANYDEYKGVIGQLNHILVGAVNMILSPAGEADLALVDGDNSNLTDNLDKICNKVSGLFLTMKQYIDRDTFVSLAEAADISAVFASAHGFNAGMVYDMDFSSVENALDCGIRIACDLLAEDDEDSIFYDFHMRVEDLDTLDAIIASAVDMILSKLLAKVDIDGWDYTYTAIDAAAVDAGTISAQDAVMDKVVDIAYEAATFAVPKINGAINEVIADLNADFDLGLGNVNFQLGVDKGANWEATLNALLDRFIDLTDGLTVAEFDKSKGAIEKASDILSAVLPMTSMFSNYNGLVAMDEALFTDAADGDFEALLSYFLVKKDAIAGDGIPVTKALINASDYIVDAFFPDTVEAQLYEATTTVQETFTGNDSDQGIAARNMVSINNRKADLIPVACNLLKESDILRSIACSHTNTEVIPAVAGNCTTPAKSEGLQCADCGTILVAPVEGEKDMNNHGTNGTHLTGVVAATCAAGGYTGDKVCDGCGNVVEAGTATPKSTAHGATEIRGAKTANCHETGYTGDTYCTVCGDKLATGSATAKNPNNHTGGTEVRGAKEATTEEEGYTGDTYCKGCGAKLATGSVIGKKSENFFQRIIRTIRGFFDRILNFFRNLF